MPCFFRPTSRCRCRAEVLARLAAMLGRRWLFTRLAARAASSAAVAAARASMAASLRERRSEEA